MNTQTSTVQHTVDSKRITELPLNGRNVLQLQSLLPGVVSWGQAGQFGHINPVFVVNGARSHMVNYVMDGGTNVNSFWNVPTITLIPTPFRSSLPRRTRLALSTVEMGEP